MNYLGMLIKSERKKLGWSQESLANGICAVSYLSKIEKGNTTPSKEVEVLLLEKLNIKYDEQLEEKASELIDMLYQLLFTGEFSSFKLELNKVDIDIYKASVSYLDFKLLNAYQNHGKPLSKYLEEYMNSRQLSMQRVLENKYDEAIALNPCAFMYFVQSMYDYENGIQYANAISTFEKAYDLASKDGSLYLMLACKMWIGNCYSNMLDFEHMEQAYQLALKISRLLKCDDYLDSIHYNTACVVLELGNYREAFQYFSSMDKHTVTSYHKYAICLEKMGDKKKALKIIHQAYDLIEKENIKNDAYRLMLEVVEYRLLNSNYLQKEEYGKLLLRCFKECKKQLPIGFAGFHLPWVIEWYTSNRLYKEAFEVYESFPIKLKKNIY